MPSATFGLFVNSSTVEAKNLTVGVESYESTVTSGVFALVGDLSAETLTINVKAAEDLQVVKRSLKAQKRSRHFS